MPWVLDGNNLAGGLDRASVRGSALALARRERVRLLLFFDGAPPAGTGNVERLGQVEVRYVSDADAAILGVLRQGGRGWLLATDDRDLGTRARSLGARVVSGADYWSRVGEASGETHPRVPGTINAAAEVAYFQKSANRLPGEGRRVTPRKRGKGRQGRR